MVETRLFDVNPISGAQTWFHFDDETDTITLEKVQDFTTLIEAAKSLHNETDERAGWKGDMHHVGWMPDTVLHQIMKAHPVFEDQQRAIKAWMNDPDNRAWRSRPGRV